MISHIILVMVHKIYDSFNKKKAPYSDLLKTSAHPEKRPSTEDNLTCIGHETVGRKKG